VKKRVKMGSEEEGIIVEVKKRGGLERGRKG
jgi:hypothetical protein